MPFGLDMFGLGGGTSLQNQKTTNQTSGPATQTINAPFQLGEGNSASASTSAAAGGDGTGTGPSNNTSSNVMLYVTIGAAVLALLAILLTMLRR